MDGFRVYVEREGAERQRDAGPSRRKAVVGVLGLVCVAVLALAARGDAPVEMQQGKQYATEVHYEDSFLERAAAMGHAGARTVEKTKLVHAKAKRQDLTWGNVGARPEHNIFGSVGSASGKAAVGQALSAVSKACAQLPFSLAAHQAQPLNYGQVVDLPNPSALTQPDGAPGCAQRQRSELAAQSRYCGEQL